MMLSTETKEPLSKRLNNIIASMERAAKTARMVSMNASVIAVRSRSNESEAYAFEAVADQILSISEDYLSRIGSLREILSEMQELTATINIAGRQRMISQRYMKLATLERLTAGEGTDYTEERRSLQQTFERTIDSLQKSRLNNRKLNEQLQLALKAWNQFIQEVDTGDIERAEALNETLLREMNEAVRMYEALGH